MVDDLMLANPTLAVPFVFRACVGKILARFFIANLVDENST